MILAMDWIFLEMEYAQYNVLASGFGEPSVDGVIINLDEDPPSALQLVESLRKAHDRLSVIVISKRPDLLIQGYRRGARSLLDHPVVLEDLSIALKNLASGNSLQKPPKGQILAILGAKGGVGTTSLAVNLGCMLAASPANKVVFVDLDLTHGAADVALDLEPESRLTDVALVADRLDLQLLKNALTPSKTGLAMLARPLRCSEGMMIEPEQLQRILTILRVFSTYVLVDLGKCWQSATVKAMHLADSLLLVVQPEIVSVRNAVLLISELAEEGLDGKVRLIVNRMGAEYADGAISIEKMEEVLGRSVYWKVPNDYKAMVGAWNEGEALKDFAPKSKAQLSLSALADDIVHGKGGASPAGKPAEVSRLSQELRNR